MAIHRIEPQQTNSSSFSIDSLYCKEEQEYIDDGEELDQDPEIPSNCKCTPPTFDLFWEEEELHSLLSKEQESHSPLLLCFQETEHLLCLAATRTEAVDWILKVKAHFGFSSLTAILAVNYVDRFISTLHFHKEDDKPWMIQLVAVTCLSLAAKVEETHVPLLLDLQVEDTKYIFEAKTIQRMEIIVMSALQWRMNPVTPLSFLDHITRRLGLGLLKTNNNSNLHWEFLKQCELLLLSAVADWRFVDYLPSVMATAAMLHVMKQVEPLECAVVEYENQLMGVLKTSKEKVSECCKLIGELSKVTTSSSLNGQMKQKQQKRKHEEEEEVVKLLDSTFTIITSSNNSSSSSNGSCVGPSFLFKKTRVQDYHYFQHFPSPTIS